MAFYKKNIFRFTLGRGSAQVFETFLHLENTQTLKSFYLKTNNFHCVSTYLMSLEKLRLSSLASCLVAAFILNQTCCRTEHAFLLASFLPLALPAASASEFVCKPQEKNSLAPFVFHMFARLVARRDHKQFGFQTLKLG